MNTHLRSRVTLLSFIKLRRASVKFLALALSAAMHNLHGSSCGSLAATFSATPPPFSTQIVNLPPQFTDVDVVCDTNTNALCATTLNVTDSTVVMDNTIPGEYTNLNDYNFLRANRSIFPTFDNELVLTPTFLVPSGGGYPAGNHFGAAVAISGDGSIIAVGSTSFNPALLQRVDIYRRQGNTWVATQVLLPPVANSLYFGSSLAMSYDGSVLAVGNPKNAFSVLHPTTTMASLGYIAMYVYDSVSKSYTLNQIIPGSALAAFGTALKLSATGQYLITNEDSIAINQPPFSSKIFTNITALVYVRSNTCDTACNTTATWTLQARLIALDNSGQPFSGEISNDDTTFTQHTTISADGGTAALGWFISSTGTTSMVALFKRQGATWQQIQFISSSTEFFTAISLSSDGSYLAVNNFFSNNVIIFKQNGPLYVQEQSIAIFPDDNSSPRSVSLSADGSILAIGSGGSSFDFNFTNIDGSVSIALRGPDGVWSIPFIKSAPLNSNNCLGASIACSADGNFIVAGAPGTNNHQGAASIFRPVGSFIPNDTVVTGSLCIYNRTIINDTLNTGVALKVRGNIHVNGTVITGTAGHVTACAANLSDERIKDDIKPLDPQEALDKLRALLPTSFQKQGKKEIGFVADDMEIVFPQFVYNRPSTNDETPFIIDGKTKNILIRAELYAYIIAALEKLVARNQRRNEELRELLGE